MGAELMNNNDEKEIDLKILIGRLVERRKFIVLIGILGLVFGLAFGIYKLFELPELQRVKLELTKSEIRSVDQVYNSYQSLQDMRDDLTEKHKTSILQNLDPNSVDKVRIVYTVETDVPANLQALSQISLSDSSITALREILKADLSVNQLGELYSIGTSVPSDGHYESADGVFFTTATLNVYGTNKDTANQMADVLEQEFVRRCQALNIDYIEVSRAYTCTYDASVQQSQDDASDKIVAVITSISDLKNSTGNFKGNQASYFEALISSQSELENGNGSSKGLSKKYPFIGLILGIMVGACWIVIQGLLANCVDSADEVSNELIAPVIVESNEINDKLAGKFFPETTDSEIAKFELKTISTEIQDMAGETVFEADLDTSAAISRMITDANFIPNAMGDPILDALALEKLSMSDTTIVVLSTRTKRTDIVKLKEYCARFRVPIKGIIFIDKPIG